MAYLQITTACNMRCRHCMFSCTEHGRHMSMEVVRAAVKFAQDHSTELFIGGGEPTCHPRFWEIFGLIMKANSDWSDGAGVPPVGLVTNGKNTEDALTLARLARNGYCSVSLSRDQYHEPIDDRVIRAFTKTTPETSYRVRENDYRDLRDRRIEFIKGTGRGRNLVGATECDACSILIAPTGSVYRCACKTRRLGSILDPRLSISSEVLDEPGCSRNPRRRLKLHRGTWMFLEDICHDEDRQKAS